MTSIAFTKTVIRGKTDADIRRMGIQLKPLHEVRLGGEGKETLDGILKMANACLRNGDFKALEKLGMARLFYKEAIVDVAQRYQKNTCHDYHIAELSRLGGFAPFETAMIILDAAAKLARGENFGPTIQNSAIVARRLAGGLDRQEERDLILAGINELRKVKPQQHNYPDTHNVVDGIRVLKTEE